VTARVEAARAAILRSLRMRKAHNRLWYAAVDEEAMVESLLSALAPLLGIAESELGAGHGVRRSSC